MTGIKEGDEAARWVELCELAKCPPDTPARAAYALTPAEWLHLRLRDWGHEVALDEVKRSWRAWRAQRDATPSVHVATITDEPEGRTDR